MKLYNTLKRSIEDFKPLEGATVRVYSCGPTVYDHAHIGNLSAYIFADTLHRVLAAAGYGVRHAMNYTDVDDKTIRRGRETYPGKDPHEALSALTDKYIGVFLEDMRKIGNDTDGIKFVRATDEKTVEGMRSLITKLYEKGFAYIADDGVYFSIEAYRNSGKKYGQLLEITAGNTSEARIQNDEYDKESVHDFALWKKQKGGEPAWPFTIDGADMAGRPGWHIECSVMSRDALGQPFDIHTGGVDLIFPHHENEIAQSTALEENPLMASVFAHNEHILVDGKKMSKSLGNFFTLNDIVEKGYDPLAFRLLVLQAHYRSQVNFTWESLEAAQNRLKSLRAFADLRFQLTENNAATVDFDFGSARDLIQEALEADLSTPAALAALGAAEQFVATNIQGVQRLQDLEEFIAYVDSVFGLGLAQSEDISEDLKQLIRQREQARQDKDWAKSDKLRGQLQEQGVGVRDAPYGPVWYRI